MFRDTLTYASAEAHIHVIVALVELSLQAAGLLSFESNLSCRGLGVASRVRDCSSTRIMCGFRV